VSPKGVSLRGISPAQASLPSPLLTGGRTEALRLPESACRLTRYETTRDYPAVTESLGPGHPLIRQLWWRDFFYHVAWHFPRVFGQPFHDRCRNLASTGCDAQPWFRIFNPWLQQKRFDPDGEYVKRWVPELENVPPAELHRPEGVRDGYPRPMVDHKTETEKTLKLYKACRG